MKNLYILTLAMLLALANPFQASSQCAVGYTQSQLNWDWLDYLVTSGSYAGSVSAAQANTQNFTMGPNRVTIAVGGGSMTLGGENTTHTGDIANYTGSDVEYSPGGDGRTITITFEAEVRNANFTLYDIDDDAIVNITAANAGGTAQNITVTTYASTILSIGGSATSRNISANNTALADNSNRGSATISVAGPVRTIVITITDRGDDSEFWLSDINACVTGSFPNNWRNVSQPFTGMPSYILTVVDNEFWLLDPATGKMKWLFTDPAHNNMNGMAYDPYHRYLYYTHSLTASPSNTRTLYRYDVNTGTISTWVADINASPLFIPTYNPGVTSGSASFYNGSLYFGVEASNSSRNSGRENTVWRIDFDGTPAQNPLRASQVYATRVDSNISGNNRLIHDWSDIGVTNNGMLYDFDGAGAGTANLDTIYYHFNMMTGQRTQFTPTGAGNIGPKQTAIDWQENVYNMGGVPAEAGSGPGQTQQSTGFIVPYNYDGTVNNALNRPVYYVNSSGANVYPTGSWGDCSEAFRPLCDFGDAPASYDPVALSPAVHEYDSTLRIGGTWDREWLKTSSAMANGDGADEDGVATVPFMAPGNGGWHVQVTVYNHTGSPATLRGWLDFNGNGVFDAAENVPTATITVPSSTSNQTFWLIWPNTPNTFVNGQATYARIRLTNSAPMGAANATGYYENGETEDYRVLIDNFPLSVNLMTFTAKTVGTDKVKLDWSSSNENNFVGYEILRSADNSNWTSLGTVFARGNGAAGTTTYTFDDASPLSGKSYYMLKLLNNDGRHRNSEVRSVTIQKDVTEIVLYPNPATEQAFLSVESNIATGGTVSISDMSGKIVYQQYVPVYNGANKINLPLGSTVESGIYMVKLSLNGTIYTRKMIVSK